MSIVARLNWAVDQWGSVRGFQRAMQERGVTGASYVNVHKILAGTAEPSIAFLQAASEVLGVRLAWLVANEGKPTEAEESIARLGDRSPELVTVFSAAVPSFDKLPAEVRPVFMEAWTRYLHGFRADDAYRMEQLGPLAATLWHAVHYPLRLPGFSRQLSGEALTDYLLLMLQALMRAIPEARTGDRIEEHITPAWILERHGPTKAESPAKKKRGGPKRTKG